MATAERGQSGTWRSLALWQGDTLDLGATRAQLPADDLYAAEMIAGTVWKDMVHHLPGDKLWLVWDGKHHRPDDASEAERIVMMFAHWYETLLGHVAQRLRVVHQGDDKALKAAEDQWEPLRKYAATLRRTAGSQALLKMLSAVVGTQPDAFTRAPWHHNTLNTADGIVTLIDGDQPLSPHAPSAMMTYLVDAPWVPGADCLVFRKLLWDATGGVNDVYEHLIKVLGYSLLGGNPLQLVFFLSGPTANGKSTILNIVSAVLGPQLAYAAKPALIEAAKYGGPRHARHEASMRGVRLISISETNDQLLIDEMQLKRLTGEEKLSVEMLYAKTMTTVDVTWLIIVANNEMPSILHLDAALRRRIWVLPMGPSIPEDRRDSRLAGWIIEHERAGILQLLVAGCRAAMAEGGRALLQPPPAVILKTTEYEADQNLAAKWLAERCVWNGTSPLINGADCYRSMQEWCERGKAPSRQQFYAQLGEVPGVRRSGDVHHVYFAGFEIKQDWS